MLPERTAIKPACLKGSKGFEKKSHNNWLSNTKLSAAKTKHTSNIETERL